MLYTAYFIIVNCHNIKNVLQNSIAFGSAPRREADSQPISPLDRQAVSQTETHTLGFLSETHTLGFLSVAHTGPSSGETY